MCLYLYIVLSLTYIYLLMLDYDVLDNKTLSFKVRRNRVFRMVIEAVAFFVIAMILFKIFGVNDYNWPYMFTGKI